MYCNCATQTLSRNLPKILSRKSALSVSLRGNKKRSLHVRISCTASPPSLILSNLRNRYVKPFEHAICARFMSTETEAAVAAAMAGIQKPSSEPELNLLQGIEPTSLPALDFLCDTRVVLAVQDALIRFHDLTGFSWSATIACSALLVRAVVVFPLMIHQHTIAARSEQVHQQLETTAKQEITKEVQRLSEEHNWNDQQMSRAYNRLMSNKRQNLLVQNNAHPLKTSVMILVQMPVWLCVSTAWRNIINMFPKHDLSAQIVYLEMKANSLLWISDLTVPDATYTIPIVIALTNLTLIQINHVVRKRKGLLINTVTYALRGAILYMAYVSSTLPTCITVYWLSSCVIGLCQNLLLMSPKVKTFFNIPIAQSARKDPLRFLGKRIRGILYFLKY